MPDGLLERTARLVTPVFDRLHEPGQHDQTAAQLDSVLEDMGERYPHPECWDQVRAAACFDAQAQGNWPAVEAVLPTIRNPRVVVETALQLAHSEPERSIRALVDIIQDTSDASQQDALLIEFEVAAGRESVKSAREVRAFARHTRERR